MSISLEKQGASKTANFHKTESVIYLDVVGKLHSLYKPLFTNPPNGYHFIRTASNWDNISNIASNIDVLYSAQINILSRFLPPNLIKSYLERSKKKPSDADLTYCVGHLNFRYEPWVVDLEFVTQLAGYNYNHFKRWRGLIEKNFSSDNCKKIICWTEAGKSTVLDNMHSSKFRHKLEVVPLAVKRKNFTKTFHGEKVTLLFVGSVNIPGEFEYKGGKEILEAFLLLQKKYTNLELVIRSDIPIELKVKYVKKMKNIRLIEGIVPWEQLEDEFKKADVFLFPSHATPGLAILDAMSYELPVITTNLWANTEMVKNGETGIVIKKSELIDYYKGNFIPGWSHYPTSKFMKTIQQITDPAVVKQLYNAICALIDDSNLRRTMGKAGRRLVEDGNFSIDNRNQKLAQVLNDALNA